MSASYQRFLILAVRIVNRMTNKQLAKHLETSTSSIISYERSRRSMPQHMIAKLRELAARAPPRFDHRTLLDLRTRISVKELAKRTGLGERTLRNYKSNKYLPNIRFIKQLNKVNKLIEWNANNLRRVQDKVGFNNREMAKLLGIHPSTWGRWLKGEMIPNIKRELLRPLEGVLRCCKD